MIGALVVSEMARDQHCFSASGKVLPYSWVPASILMLLLFPCGINSDEVMSSQMNLWALLEQGLLCSGPMASKYCSKVFVLIRSK